jgi:hypothetical protein
MSATRWARIGFSLVAWLFAIGTVIQVYLAGQGVFATGGNFELHRNFGFIFGALTIVMVVLSLAGRMPRLALIGSMLLVALMVVQSVLVRLPDIDPNIAALHPVVGTFIVGIAFWLAATTLRQLRAPLPIDREAEAIAKREAELAALSARPRPDED